MNIPRNEYPRPQFFRDAYEILNGEWDFAVDAAVSGVEHGWSSPDAVFDKKITVPFCPESVLSGIGNTDFMDCVWYKRVINVPEEKLSGRAILNFGAVDYLATVYVNGKYAGSHRGGYVSFSVDATHLLVPGKNVVTVRAYDDVRSQKQPSGKQSQAFASAGCHYTRTTGIWQTVWMEFVPKTYIKRVETDPDCVTGAVSFKPEIAGDEIKKGEKYALKARILFEGAEVARGDFAVKNGRNFFSLSVSDPKLWDVGKGVLYDVEYVLEKDGKAVDCVKSYIGFRSLELKKNGLYINGRPVFQRLVLDQGFYPDGIYTAPTDEALQRDIDLSMALGFNGARLHEKVFEERFLYWADVKGYLVWGEYPNWGLQFTDGEDCYVLADEWIEEVKRDMNHPAIIGWAPFNETWDTGWKRQSIAAIEHIYKMTKALDPTRPVIDTSGGYHVGASTDIYDVHDYEQNVEKWEKRYLDLEPGKIYDPLASRQSYAGQPYFVSEYGGTWWAKKSGDGTRKTSWGYGVAPISEKEFADRYYGLTTTLLKQKRICAFCYTQLTDVEQEQNGLYAYDRSRKLPDSVYEKIVEANTYPAAFEEE